MVDYIFIFLSQVLLFLFRTLNVMHIARNKKWKAVMSSTLFQSAWLFSSYIGIKNLMEGNVWIIASFLLGTSLGTIIAFRLR